MAKFLEKLLGAMLVGLGITIIIMAVSFKAAIGVFIVAAGLYVDIVFGDMR